MDLQRHISMCTRHHAKWKRMSDFAMTQKDKRKYLDRAMYWLDMQSTLVSMWSIEQKTKSNNMRTKINEMLKVIESGI